MTTRVSPPGQDPETSLTAHGRDFAIAEGFADISRGDVVPGELARVMTRKRIAERRAAKWTL